DGERIETDLGDTKPDGKWDLTMVGPGAARVKGRLIVCTEKDTTVRFATAGDTLKATAVRLEPGRVSFTLEDPRLGGARALVLDQKGDRMTGRATMSGGTRSAVEAWRAPEEDKGGKGGRGEGAAKAAADTARIVTPQVAGDPEAWRARTPDQPKAVLIHNATVWTSGPQGRIENADLLVRAGKIAAVGKGLSAAGALVVDATGKHVAPRIIACHIHSPL